VEEPCADEWFSLGVGSAWVEQTVNFNNGWYPVDESKYTDQALKQRATADLVFARNQIQAWSRSSLVLPTSMRVEVETRTATDVAVDESETVAGNVRLTVPVVLEWPTEVMTECTDEGSVELTATEVQQGEAIIAMIGTPQAVRPTEVMVMEQPVEPSAAALQEAVARAAARAACLARAGKQAATIAESVVIASTVTTRMTEATADMPIGAFGAVRVDDMTRTAVHNMEVATRAEEATETTAVVEVIAGTAGMTEAAAYTTAGVVGAAGAAETTTMASATSTVWSAHWKNMTTRDERATMTRVAEATTARTATTGIIEAAAATTDEVTTTKKKKKGRRSHKGQGRDDRNRLSQNHRQSLTKHHSMDSTDVHPSGSNSDE